MPVVSVGCGKGRLEEPLSWLRDVYFVDPYVLPGKMSARDRKDLQTAIYCEKRGMDDYLTPTRFAHVQELAAQPTEPWGEMCYDYVKTLVEAHPELVGNCIVFINWSLPNDSIYDIESIGLLKPKHVVTVCETTGSAGGAAFLKWLNMCGVHTDSRYHYYESEDDDLAQYGLYNVVATTSVSMRDKLFGGFDYTLVWLSSDKLDITYTFPPLAEM
jgi:hypothetical protein